MKYYLLAISIALSIFCSAVLAAESPEGESKGGLLDAEAILLNTTWAEVNEAFGTRDAGKAWAAFDKARNACMACHVAESVPYMNNQHLFDLSRPSSKTKKPLTW